MPKMKKEKTEKLKKAVVVIKKAPVIVDGKKYNPDDVITDLPLDVMKRLVNEGICEWQEN